jgi:hypothetical protein
VLQDGGDASRCFLTDFGASFCYDKEAAYGRLLEKIEMRAYTQLVEELRGALPDVARDVFERDEKRGLEALAGACKGGEKFEEVRATRLITERCLSLSLSLFSLSLSLSL